jgi:ABC-type histidine transport system ATPase subunit
MVVVNHEMGFAARSLQSRFYGCGKIIEEIPPRSFLQSKCDRSELFGKGIVERFGTILPAASYERQLK